MLRRIAIICLAGAAVLAPASWDGIADSIHFYGANVWEDADLEMDWGRLPQPFMISGWNNEPWRAGTDGDEGYQAWNERIYMIGHLWQRARIYEVRREYAKALELFRRVYELRSSVSKDDYLQNWPFVENDISAFRSFLRDREEVYKLPDSTARRDYLKARYILQSSDIVRHFKARTSLGSLKADPVVGPHAWYAATEIHEADEYLMIAQRYPKSPRAPAALLMAARQFLALSKTPRFPAERLAKGVRVLNRLISRYPRSPYTASAHGWLGRAYLLQGKRSQAMRSYQTQLKLDPTEGAWSAHESLAIIYKNQGRRDLEVIHRLLQRATPTPVYLRTPAGLAARRALFRLDTEETKRVKQAVRKDHRLLAAYLTFRLEDTKLNVKSEKALANFASSALRGLPHADRATIARVAQLSYNTGSYRQAVALTQRAFSRPGTDIDRLRARYIAAAANSRLGRYSTALAGYRSIFEGPAPRYLHQGALEAYAVLNERHGDPVQALWAYYRLNYDWDIAFLADAKLTPAQLKRFIAILPSKERPKFNYALGLRYLRLGQYGAAKATFLSVPARQRSQYGLDKVTSEQTEFVHEDSVAPRDPLKVTADLAHFDLQFRQAKTKDGQAQALYDKGAYIYRYRNLLFYNPALWKGDRAWVIDMFWNNTTNGAQDERDLQRHCWEHECMAQSLKLFERVINHYPDAKVRPKALYSASLSALHLSGMNQWWRSHSNGLEWKGVHYLQTIVKKYPTDPLIPYARKYASVYGGSPVAQK